LSRQEFDIRFLRRLCLETTPTVKTYLAKGDCRCVLGDLLDVLEEMTPGKFRIAPMKADRTSPFYGVLDYYNEESLPYITSIPRSISKELGWTSYSDTNIDGCVGEIDSFPFSLASLSDARIPKQTIAAIYLGYFSGNVWRPELRLLQEEVWEKLSYLNNVSKDDTDVAYYLEGLEEILAPTVEKLTKTLKYNV